MSEKWQKVVFLSDCTFEDWDEDRECPRCPVCGQDWAECSHPGPGQDEDYRYKEVGGVLYAKEKPRGCYCKPTRGQG